MVGAAVEPKNFKSDPTHEIFFMKSMRFDAMVTPLTAPTSSPFSIRSPLAHMEKSPLTGSIV